MQQNTKKIILVSIASLAGIVLLGALGWFVYFVSQFASYQDSLYHFSVKYPKEWKVIKNPQPSLAAMFISPKETAMDVFQENFNVTVQPVPEHLASLATYSETITRQMTAVFKTNIKIVEDKPFQFGGRRGHRMIFEAPKPDALKTVVAWTIKGDQAYILMFMGKMDKYKQLSPMLEEILKSFALK